MTEPTSLKKTAHITGVLYFILAVLGVYNLEYLPSQIVVYGDDVATCQNILTHEFLFRTGIASSVITNILYIFSSLWFYRLFKNVNQSLARLLVILVLVQIPVSLILDTLDITSLRILKGEVLKLADVQRSQEYSILLRKIVSNSIGLEQVYWGLWLFPMGILAYRSGFIPRIIGVLVLITGFAYVIECLVFILLPTYRETMDKFMFPLFFGELSIIFWLLIKGVKKSYA